MKETPILFTGAMVRAILDGRKTQTRRVLKYQPEQCHVETQCSYNALLRGCPYGQPGDKLWVKETFQLCEWFQDHWEPAKLRNECQSVDKFYAADGVLPDQSDLHWRPSIFMPRWASRITLELTAVRVERVQNITEEDAMAEGVDWQATAGLSRFTAKKLYATLWDSINGKKHPWASNPWVWVLTFKRI